LTEAGPGANPHRRGLLVLLAAGAISETGNRLSVLAVPWFVLQTTGSATLTGVTGFFTLLPVVLSSLFGGVVVDRLGYKRASIVADLASGLPIALIPLLYAAGLLEFWLLLALTFLGALLDAPGSTARAALVPDLAERGGVRIEWATSATQIVDRGARLLGAPLAGGLIALVGATAVLWVDAATFAISATLVALAVPYRRMRAAEDSAGYVTELSAGLRFIRGDQLIFALLLVLAVTNFLDAAWASVVAPVFAREVYGSAVALGLLFGASGGGAVVGHSPTAPFGTGYRGEQCSSPGSSSPVRLRSSYRSSRRCRSLSRFRPSVGWPRDLSTRSSARWSMSGFPRICVVACSAH